MNELNGISIEQKNADTVFAIPITFAFRIVTIRWQSLIGITRWIINVTKSIVLLRRLQLIAFAYSIWWDYLFSRWICYWRFALNADDDNMVVIMSDWAVSHSKQLSGVRER